LLNDTRWQNIETDIDSGRQLFSMHFHKLRLSRMCKSVIMVEYNRMRNLTGLL